jgi:WD40 repeat protein
MDRVFISYRREDTKGIAGRIYDRLQAKFGRELVFMDIDSIPFGADFHDFLGNQVKQARIVLLLIGPRWAEVQDGAGRRRLENPNDFVRIEVEVALQNKRTVIPILIDGAQMPEAQALPEPLQALSRLNAAVLDAGRDFHSHMDRLIDAIEQKFSEPEPIIELPLPSSASAPVCYERQRLIRTFRPEFSVRAVAFSPDLRSVILANSHCLEEWEIASGKKLREFGAHSSEIKSVIGLRGSRTLFSASEKGVVKLLDFATGKELHVWNIGKDVTVKAAAISPDERSVLVTGYGDVHFRQFDLRSGKELTKFNTDEVMDAVAYSPDGQMALTGGWESVKLWHTETGRKISDYGFDKDTTCVAFHPNGRTGFSAWDQYLRVFDILSGKVLASHYDTLYTGNWDKKIYSIGILADGLAVLAAGEYATANILDIASGKVLCRLDGHKKLINSLAISRDGRFAVTGSTHDYTARVWDLTDLTVSPPQD